MEEKKKKCSVFFTVKFWLFEAPQREWIMILIEQITKDSKKWEIFNFKWRVNIASEIMISAPFWKSVILLYKTWVFKGLK